MKKNEYDRTNKMPLYQNCGFLGLFPEKLTEAEFESNAYSLNGVYTSCGFLGFDAKRATYDDLPPSYTDCTPPSAPDGAVYSLTSTGDCSLSCKDGYSLDDAGTSCVVSPPAEDNTPAPVTCDAGEVKRPKYTVGELGKASCPAGYSVIQDSSTCFEVGGGTLGIGSGTGTAPGPSGCYVHVGKDGKSGTYFRSGGGGGEDGRSFVVCGRQEGQECAKVGSQCRGASLPNYTWDSDGKCVGECSLTRGCAHAAPVNVCCIPPGETKGTCYTASALTTNGGACPGHKATDDKVANFLGDVFHSLVH